MIGHRLLLALLVLWASPWSLLGLVLGAFNLLGGGRVYRQGRVIEFEGPFLQRLLRRVPITGGASAMTLGHVVIATDREQLDRTRAHEFVHVQQYQRWGPFFVPAYLISSLWIGLRGGDPYLDNPFEREAYDDS